MKKTMKTSLLLTLGAIACFLIFPWIPFAFGRILVLICGFILGIVGNFYRVFGNRCPHCGKALEA